MTVFEITFTLCSLPVLEWRKSQLDSTPNGYVDLTEVKLISTGDESGNAMGLTIDGKYNCFTIIDNANVEHIFCTETIRSFERWLPYLELFNHNCYGGSNGNAHSLRIYDSTKDGDAQNVENLNEKIVLRPDESSLTSTSEGFDRTERYPVSFHDHPVDTPSSDIEECAYL